MILIIDKSKEIANNIADTFYYMGILSTSVSPNEAFGEISPLYNAVLVTSLHTFADVGYYIEKLRQYAADIPIFAIGDTGVTRYNEIFTKCFPIGGYTAEIANAVVNFCAESNSPLPGRYVAAGIDVSAELSYARYCSQPIPLTKTEMMILRALVRAYPDAISAERILKCAYRKDRIPSLSNVRTHISKMNKKIFAATGKRLICPVYKTGYSLALSPESEPIELLSANM